MLGDYGGNNLKAVRSSALYSPETRVHRVLVWPIGQCGFGARPFFEGHASESGSMSRKTDLWFATCPLTGTAASTGTGFTTSGNSLLIGTWRDATSSSFAFFWKLGGCHRCPNS